MAQESSEASVASSSPTPNWWEMHANPISSWNAINPWQPHSNVSSSCDDRDISISATSFNNQSTTNSCHSIDSSSAADLPGEPGENHLWSHVLFGVGGHGGDMHNNHDGGENFLEGVSSKNLATEMFDPACDYLKKLDISWEFTNNPQLLNRFEKQLNTYSSTMIESEPEPERMTNLSDLVSNWSIAPPNPTSMAQYSMSNLSQIKHEIANSDRSFPGNQMGGLNDYGRFEEPIRSSFSDSVIGQNKYCSGIMTDARWSTNNATNLSDLIAFGNRSSKPAMEFRASSESKKQGYDTTSSTRGNGRGSEGKKKRSEDSSEALFKRSKHESSNASSLKSQAPKVKLGERITALQQIVSPFGKTDTASVLLEAINFIRFFQEQVQLLSDPYLKSSPNKEHNSWEGLERKDKSAELKSDLKNRGLCLVPISCTPQVYRENAGPDYWTPTYRGCLYR